PLVAVLDTLGIAGGGPRPVALSLVRPRAIDALRGFGRVRVDGRISLVIPGLADQPAEDACSIGGIEDAAIVGLAVDGRDVVPRDRSPVGVARARPALDARERSLDAREVAPHLIAIAQLLDDLAVGAELGYQVLGAAEDEHIGLVGVA